LSSILRRQSCSIAKSGFQLATALLLLTISVEVAATAGSLRERISLDDNWRFIKGDPSGNSVSLLYDTTPAGRTNADSGSEPAD